MAVLKCKMCGGDLNIQEGLTVAECEYCGSKQTVPTADNEKKMTLFARANRLRAACEFDKAAGVYESIVAEFPEEAEAYWGLLLCRFGIEYVDDPATGKKIPTCHRSSFDSVMDDSDFEQVMENADALARRVYRDEAKAIEELRKRIIEVSSKEEPYDIFICYKETGENGERTIDSVIAQDVYDALTEKGYKVFFSRITLEDKLGVEYEPYIFAALNSAKIMLAFGTDYEYYNAVWVKNEWSRFLALIAKGEKKTLIPCYKGIDAYDMPKEFAKLQAQDMGKVGAMQDLLRGIGKILGDKQPAAAARSGNPEAEAMRQRGFLALEDRDYDDAERFFERALDADPSDARTYLGKLFLQYGAASFSDFEHKYIFQLEDNKFFKRAVQFADPALANELRSFKETNALNIERLKLLYVLKAVTKTKELQEKKAANIEKNYVNACSLQAKGDEESLNSAAWLFTTLKGYKDSTERAEECQRAFKDMKDKRVSQYKRMASARLQPTKDRIAKYRGMIANPSLNHIVALKKNGRMLAVGDNKDGQCNVEDWDGITAFSASGNFTVGIKENGTAVAVGNNDFGQCNVSDWTDIISIVVGMSLSFIIGMKSNGTVLAVGDNGCGQCDVSSWTDITAIAVGGAHTVGLKSDGTVVAAGNNTCSQCNVSGWTDIISIAAGPLTTYGLKEDGTVVATGTNDHGECDISQWTDIAEIVAGDKSVVGLRWNGTVVAAGNILNRECVDNWTDIVGIAIGESFAVGLKADGTVVSTQKAYGHGDYSEWRDIVSIAAGDKLIGLRDDGTLAVYSEYYTFKYNAEISRWKLFINDAEKETDYQNACRLQEMATSESLKQAADLFDDIAEYQDSRNRANICRDAYAKAKAREDHERAEREAAEKAERQRKTAERQRKIAALNNQRHQLQLELTNLKGLFTGKRRKEIEAQIAQIDSELKKL